MQQGPSSFSPLPMDGKMVHPCMLLMAFLRGLLFGLRFEQRMGSKRAASEIALILCQPGLQHAWLYFAAWC